MLGAEPRAVGIAEAGLADKEPQVRGASGRALGEMCSIKCVPELVDAAKDENLSVALAAAHSLIALKDNVGYEVYYAVMTGERKKSGMIEQQWDELKEPKKSSRIHVRAGNRVRSLRRGFARGISHAYEERLLTGASSCR